MKKNNKIILSSILILILTITASIICFQKNSPNPTTNKIEATILATNNNTLTVQDKDNVIYTFKLDDLNLNIGDDILIKYTGILDKNKSIQTCDIVDYKTYQVNKTEDDIPTSWQDNGLFSTYYLLAYNKLKTLSLDEKIGQILLVRYPDSNQIEDLKKYKFSGFVFYEKDFKQKNKNQVINMITELRKTSNIPLLTAVDEEGGSVVRVSSNPQLAQEPFKSPSELYIIGGFDLIRDDTIKKSQLLNSLGLNLNLAPVVDVPTDSSSYIYNRTLKQDTDLTSTYAKTVIEASHNTGVSYTLKHFPGYSNNKDTHEDSATDTRTYEEILKNDLPPFKKGIETKAEAILVSHNIVTNIDSNNPASLSQNIHNLLRNELNFTGIIITDDLDMSATSKINNAIIEAILAGNDLIITTNYKENISIIKNAIQTNTISEDLINKLAFRVLAWKYYKGLMYTNQK